MHRMPKSNEVPPGKNCAACIHRIDAQQKPWCALYKQHPHVIEGIVFKLDRCLTDSPDKKKADMDPPLCAGQPLRHL